MAREPQPPPRAADIDPSLLWGAAESFFWELHLSSGLAFMLQLTFWLFPKALSEENKNKLKECSTSPEQHLGRLRAQEVLRNHFSSLSLWPQCPLEATGFQAEGQHHIFPTKINTFEVQTPDHTEDQGGILKDLDLEGLPWWSRG